MLARMTRVPVLSPVLLVGAGTGEATCGILYLAGYLRRGGIEAFVRLFDTDETPDAIARSLEALLAHVRPRVVGISLKWFHHVHRALLLARTVRRLDPTIRIVVGGNSAAHWWKELAALDYVDDVVLGDGEAPLLALCQGDPEPPNCVPHGVHDGPRPKLGYVQRAANSDDVYYSHFGDIFLSERDRNAFSGWVAPGKGCAESCLYCGGTRRNQVAEFGRATPYVRSPDGVRRDHVEIAPRTWQVRYDFSGSTVEFLQASWHGVDLSAHACTYFLWGVPRVGLVDALARKFAQVHVVIDVGCFSEPQRLALIKRGLLKACASDVEVWKLVDDCARHANLDLEVSGIAGLPGATDAILRDEVAFAERLVAADCVSGYQRLEAQPGAFVTEQPERFAMRSEAATFAEFLAYFEQQEPGDRGVPMVRFRDPALERDVQRTTDRVSAIGLEHRAARRRVPIHARTRLVNTAPSTRRFTLGDWLGPQGVPAGLAREEVTVVRSVDGADLICAPSVSPRRFRDPTMEQGENGRVLLSTLAAFAEPTTVVQASAWLGARAKLDPRSARQVIDHLLDGRFLQPV
jgi:hypothetical protein